MGIDKVGIFFGCNLAGDNLLLLRLDLTMASHDFDDDMDGTVEGLRWVLIGKADGFGEFLRNSFK